MGRMLRRRAFFRSYIKSAGGRQWYLNLANRRQDVPLTEEKVLVSSDVSFSGHLTPLGHLHAAAGQVACKSLCEWTFPGVSVVPAVSEGISPGGISRRSGGGENCHFENLHQHPLVPGDGGHPEASERSGDAWTSILCSGQGYERKSQHQAGPWQGPISWQQVQVLPHVKRWMSQSWSGDSLILGNTRIWTVGINNLAIRSSFDVEKCGCECESEFSQNPKSIQIWTCLLKSVTHNSWYICNMNWNIITCRHHIVPFHPSAECWIVWITFHLN